VSRLLVFKLGANAQLPPESTLAPRPLDPPAVTGSPEQIAEGGQNYGRFCGVCHGDAAYGGTLLPDLRRSPLLDTAKGWATVVRDGALQSKGMVGFADALSPGQIDSIRAYVIKRANEDKALGEK